jgi:radical SAM superfamily enzyme YgiQ (UPF0313 family)
MAICRLIFVHSAHRDYADTQMFGIHFPPVWAYTLAAHLEEGGDHRYEFDVLDDRVQDLGGGAGADYFLYSGMNQDLPAILANRRILAKAWPKAKHLIGGPIAWSFRQAGKLHLLDEFDHVFIGDGEGSVRASLESLRAGKPLPKVVTSSERFNLSSARVMHRPLLEKTLGRYYGAVIEVSRGCPFLCEFCDIRVQSDNNRSHVKPVELLVAEIDYFARERGKGGIILACDNFIGNTKWAEELCDAIIAWKERTGLAPVFYTWLSIDVARHPSLMPKLRRAGITMLFIGVESFHRNSLLETAKVQNTSIDMVQEIRKVQAHGLIVVAGLIFGFDTDPENIVDITLDGIREAGLISGDPSLLTALPGTPLYLRMKLSGRLREGKVGLGGLKYQTNIKYLKPTARVIEDFRLFSTTFNTGSFQLARLRSFLACLPPPAEEAGPSSAPARGRATGGEGIKLSRLLLTLLGQPRPLWLFVKRVGLMVRSPSRVWAISRAVHLVATLPPVVGDKWMYLRFWLFNWSNSLMKYHGLRPEDFDIGSVDAQFKLSELVPDGYEDARFEPIPEHKIRMQRKNTADSLRRLITSGAGAGSGRGDE